MHDDVQQNVTPPSNIPTRKKSNQGHRRECTVELVLGQWRLFHDRGEPVEDPGDV